VVGEHDGEIEVAHGAVVGVLTADLNGFDLRTLEVSDYLLVVRAHEALVEGA